MKRFFSSVMRFCASSTEAVSSLERLEFLGPASGLLQLGHQSEHPVAELGQDDEGELRALELARDLDVDARQLLLVGLHGRALALRHQRTHALDGALDARGDLAGLLVAHRLGELGPGVGERAQRVPAGDDVARGAGNRVERIAQLGRGRLELLREEHLLLAP
jgi:hypothetical protein